MLDRIFMQIVKMSFTASIVIAVVLIARLFLKKAPKVFSYALWSVVLIRLICPFSLKSFLSLIPKKADNISQQIVTSNTPNTVVSAPPIINAPHPNINIPQPTITKDAGIDWLLVIGIIWIIGIAIMFTYSLISFIKLNKKLKYSLNYRDNIYLCENLKSPFVMGIFSPKIYLPSNLTDDEKEYIILHEQMHIKRFDHIIKIISFLGLCVHWFNPLVWIAFLISGKDMEMSCDESVIKKLGNDVKKDYSTSLLSLATGKRIIGGIPLAFGEGQTKSRIKNILNYKKPRFWVVIVCVLAVIAVCVGLITNPKEKKSIVDDDYLVNAEIIDIDSEHKILMIKGIEKADENSLSGDRCYLSCDKATIYKNNEEVDFSQLKIGNKIACEITEVLESYPTQADTKIIKITDDNFTEPLFKVDTSMLNSLDSLENVSTFAFTEYTEYLNSQKEDEVDKEDFNLTSKKLISGDIRDFVYEYEYTHTRPIDSSLPKQSKVQLHIVNINGNGIQYYVMSADGDIETDFDGYKSFGYNDDEYVIKAKIPQEWNHYSYTVNSEKNEPNNGGLGITFPDGGTVFVTRYINLDIPQIKSENYSSIKDFETNSNLKGKLYYSEDNDNVSINIRFADLPTFEIKAEITTNKYDEIETELYSFFKSVEITKTTSDYIDDNENKDKELYVMTTDNAKTDVITKTKDSYTITFPAYQEGKQDYNAFIYEHVPFNVNITLPDGWSVDLPPESERKAGNPFTPVYMYKDDEYIGYIGFNTFELYEGTTEDNFYRSVYNQLMLGSVVSWDCDYTPVVEDDNFCSATCKVMERLVGNDGRGAEADVIYYPAIVAYNKDLLVYTAMQFGQNTITEEQQKEIAKSISISLSRCSYN